MSDSPQIPDRSISPRHHGSSSRDGTDGERGSAFEQQMRSAERDAHEYLERAKQRADTLVSTMIGAVEREAEEIKREAEAGIRERWSRVEAEAGRYLDDARRVADNMVSERQQRIGALSDGIVGRARALTAGMEDADRIKRQFDGFVRALSETADLMARQSSATGPAEVSRLRDRPGASSRRAAAA